MIKGLKRSVEAGVWYWKEYQKGRCFNSFLAALPPRATPKHKPPPLKMGSNWIPKAVFSLCKIRGSCILTFSGVKFVFSLNASFSFFAVQPFIYFP